jgi:glutathione peroxidase-family protein
MYRPAVLFLLALGGCTSSHSNAPASPAGELYATPLTQLDGTPLPTDTLAGQVVVFVNVASTCGYTPQYEGLQALYEAHRDDGLVIVGVPCNQFGGQEPGTAESIATFCKTTYGVTFPLLEKQSVNGSERSALYQQLVGSGDDVRWNFEKFVVGRDGTVQARFPSSTQPDSGELRAAIEQALAQAG